MYIYIALQIGASKGFDCGTGNPKCAVPGSQILTQCVPNILCTEYCVPYIYIDISVCLHYISVNVYMRMYILYIYIYLYLYLYIFIDTYTHAITRMHF